MIAAAILSRSSIVTPYDGESQRERDDLSSCGSSKATIRASNVTQERKREVSDCPKALLYCTYHRKKFLNVFAARFSIQISRLPLPGLLRCFGGRNKANALTAFTLSRSRSLLQVKEMAARALSGKSETHRTLPAHRSSLIATTPFLCYPRTRVAQRRTIFANG